MERDIINQLLVWKNKETRQPLILTGARQVGKTWVMQEFGKKYFKNTAYLSLDNNPALKDLFERTVHPKDLIPFLSAEAGVTIDKDTLLILDEIQKIPKALTSLKYFCEETPKIHVIAAGSTLGVSLHSGVSFPVGKVEFMTLYPMSFYEFLDALSQTNLRKVIENKNYELLNSFHDKIIDIVKQYIIVGGMPEAVKEFVKSQSFIPVRNVQNKILQSYEKDFSKYSSAEMAIRISLVWKAVPAQLAKENRRFIYGAVRKGARARDFEVAIQWLMDSSLIYKVSRVSVPNLPLKSYEDFGIFKLFMFDIGLLCAISGVSEKIILEKNAIFKEFKGKLTEQFVLQEMLTAGIKPFYWSVINSQAEIDFIIQKDNEIFPIEVKSSTNLQAKSLKVYKEKFQPKKSLRISQANYKSEKNTVDLPLYLTAVCFD